MNNYRKKNELKSFLTDIIFFIFFIFITACLIKIIGIILTFISHNIYLNTFISAISTGIILGYYNKYLNLEVFIKYCTNSFCNKNKDYYINNKNNNKIE